MQRAVVRVQLTNLRMSVLCIALFVRVSPKSLMLSLSRKALSVMFLMYIWMRVQSDMELGQWKKRSSLQDFHCYYSGDSERCW